MSSLISRLFAVRSVDSILKELDTAPPMNRVLTARSLTAIGLGSTIGAGSVITKTAPPGELTLARAPQVTKPGWKRPLKKK